MSVPMPEPRPPTCQLRVASKNEDCVAAYIRRQRLEIGRPLTFDEQYPGITALEAFAGAFAGEVMSGLRLRARKRRIELGEVEGVVKVWLTPRIGFSVPFTETPKVWAVRTESAVSYAILVMSVP